MPIKPFIILLYYYFNYSANQL